MSSKKQFLVLRLEGPLQSWGFDSQYNRRNTGLMPTKSAIAGMCCAALGLSRGSKVELKFLKSFSEIRMTTIAIPKKVLEHELCVGRLQDYHTIQNTRKASGGIKGTHITHRQYLTDAAFGVLLEANTTILGNISRALADPKWGIWLGRKTCIPSAPILVGMHHNKNEALALLLGEEPIEAFTRQEDVKYFSEGKDSLPDSPVSFAPSRRIFTPRRVRIRHAGEV